MEQSARVPVEPATPEIEAEPAPRYLVRRR